MISRDTLLARTRRLLGDEDARTFSDYELTAAIDDGLTRLGRHLALLGSDLTEKSLTMKNGDTLPDDLITLRAVFDGDGRQLVPLRAGLPIADGGYRIEGDTFLAADGCTITYQKSLPPLGEASSLDLPPALTDTIAKTAALVLAGADGASCAKALAEDDMLLMRRKWTRRTPDMPWRI